MNKEQKVAIIAAMIPILVFIANLTYLYWDPTEYTVTFTVFDKWCYLDQGVAETQILTWGNSTYGKYYFIGNWTNQFHLDHTYNVTYVQQTPGRPWQNLVVIKWSDIS